jgi:hypothetical protein
LQYFQALIASAAFTLTTEEAGAFTTVKTARGNEIPASYFQISSHNNRHS